MGERIGILMAMLSSALGGGATALIRFMIRSTDPVMLAALRFGSGFVLLLPVALWLRSPWPRGRDWAGVLGLGILFFGLCFALFNWALSFTTAGRGALAMSTLPLLTMLAGALLGVERLTLRKSLGVFVAIAGTSLALVTGLAAAPSGAWRGDLIMLAAALCMALYNVWSRPFIKRSDALAFVTATMGAGASCLAAIAWIDGGFAALGEYGMPQWLALLYLGAIASSLSFFLWVSALERTTPTRVASTLTLNPVTASALAAFILGEPIGLNLIIGMAAVLTGIWIASTDGGRRLGTAGDGFAGRDAEYWTGHHAEYWYGWRPGYRTRRDDDHGT
ncbi:MAG: DMT family transporter [Proteobacteria bacterium]|nr:DMT family transporter [Pseudomonadota bacterium]MBI3498222.1 DMT family transporter [Pseudomonadota bacterium]